MQLQVLFAAELEIMSQTSRGPGIEVPGSQVLKVDNGLELWRLLLFDLLLLCDYPKIVADVLFHLFRQPNVFFYLLVFSNVV